MRQRTKIDPQPDPNLSEFGNFDRFMRILVTKGPQHKTKKSSASDLPKDQDRDPRDDSRRLPRP